MIRSKMHVRRGLTLLELVMVLAILAALGGLLIPLLRRERAQASDGSSIDAIRELTKIVAEYEQMTLQFPNKLESLIANNSTLFSKLPGENQPGDGHLTPFPLSASQANALNRKGITILFDANESPDASATFGGTADSRALGVSVNVVQLSNQSVLRQLGKSPGSQLDASGVPVPNIFVVFGFGMGSSIIGSHISEAPYRTPTYSNPNITYSRFGLVFEIPGEAAIERKVYFTGAVAFDSNRESDGNRYGVRGVQSLTEDFFTND